MFSVKQLTEVTLCKDSLYGTIERNMKNRDDSYTLDIRIPNRQHPNHAFISMEFMNEANTIAVYNALQKELRKVTTLNDVLPILNDSQELTLDEYTSFKVFAQREQEIMEKIREMVQAPKPYNNDMYNISKSDEGCTVVITIECNKLVLF